MDQDLADRATPTRRACLKGGGALFAGSLLAGCTGQNDVESLTDTTRTTTTTAAGGNAVGHTASVSPAGDVMFEPAPENMMVYDPVYADAAAAFGYGDAMDSLGFDSGTGGRTLDACHECLDGVSLDRSGLAQLNLRLGSINTDKEPVCEPGSDLYPADPVLAASSDGWDQSDVEKTCEQIVPWLGNAYSRAHARSLELYADDYQYYTLWEVVENIGQVFREEDHYTVLETVHSSLLDTARSDLPPESEQPSVGVIIYMDEASYPTKIDALGFVTLHIRPLGVTDAFAVGDVTFETSYDLEAMFEIDLDVLLHSYSIDSYYDVALTREILENHPVGGELSAVRNDHVCPSGTPVQGPTTNLFQTEMAAKQFYPDHFGAQPTYDGGVYPVIPEGERLLNHKRVADIVTGD